MAKFVIKNVSNPNPDAPADFDLTLSVTNVKPGAYEKVLNLAQEVSRAGEDGRYSLMEAFGIALRLNDLLRG